MLLQFSIGATPGSGWNVIGTPLVAGLKFAAGTVVDSTGAVVPGLTVNLTTAFSSGPGTAGTNNADSYPANVKTNYISIEGAANPVFVLGGGGAGSAAVTVYGNRGTVSTGDRITNVTATGQSGSTFTDSLDARGDAGAQADREAAGSVTTGASDSVTISMTKTGTAGHVNAIVVDFTPTATGADITSVTGPGSVANLIRQGESSTIAGAGFEASQSTGNTDLDGTSLTETAWSDTSITITGPSSGEMFGASKTLTVTPATNTADSIAGQTYLPPTGQSYITFDAGGISGMSAASIGDGITGLAATDQARFETTATKVGAPGTTCTVTVADGSGNIELTNVTAAGDYEFSAWFRDASDATDSGESVITFDATVPEIASVTIDETTLTVTLTENAAIGAGGSGGVTLTGQYGAITATYDSISTTNILFDISRPAYDNEVLTLNYVQPGAGITDTVGNELATITGQAITNNSTEVYISADGDMVINVVANMTTAIIRGIS